MALPRKASGAKHVSRGDALGGRVILLCLLLVLNKTSVSRALVDILHPTLSTPSCTSNHT